MVLSTATFMIYCGWVLFCFVPRYFPKWQTWSGIRDVPKFLNFLYLLKHKQFSHMGDPETKSIGESLVSLSEGIPLAA